MLPVIVSSMRWCLLVWGGVVWVASTAPKATTASRIDGSHQAVAPRSPPLLPPGESVSETGVTGGGLHHDRRVRSIRHRLVAWLVNPPSHPRLVIPCSRRLKMVGFQQAGSIFALPVDQWFSGSSAAQETWHCQVVRSTSCFRPPTPTHLRARPYPIAIL